MQLGFFESSKLILFGGKGGVGKTTSAAATALHMAGADPDRKILILSTDPAHSLSDSFDRRIGNEPTKIVPNLYALEIDTKKLQKRFIWEHQVDIFDLATRTMYFDKDLLFDFFSFSLPGMDELIALMEIISLLNAGKYDIVILDTAPAGHTIRLLSYIEMMLKQLDVMEMSQTKYRDVEERRRTKYVKNEADEFLDGMRKDLQGLKSILADTSATVFVVVTIPEAMGVYEMERLVTALKSNKINIGHIIINGIRPRIECDFCISRRKKQDKYIREIENTFSGYDITRMPLFTHEVRGVENLRRFADVLFGERYEYVSHPVKLPEPREAAGSNIRDLLKRDLQYLFFGGKGGVGKTVCAAATALYIAENSPGKKILIFSASPVHALSDSFECEIGDEVTSITPNLYGLEIDAKKMFDDFKKRYIDEINVVFDSIEDETPGADLSFDRRVTLDLFNLTPPGLDEIMALVEIVELTESREYDIFVLDTAPTGHLLRLLELPDIITEWLSRLIKILGRYRKKMQITATIELLQDTERRVQDTQRILKDPEKTEFVTVTIPEAMGILETERLFTTLHELEIPSDYLIVNRITPQTTCSFCASRREEQQEHLKEINGLFPEKAIAEMPLLPHEVKGLDALLNFGKIMYR